MSGGGFVYPYRFKSPKHIQLSCFLLYLLQFLGFYAMLSLVLPAPRQAVLPVFYWGVLIFLPPIERKGVTDMVTWEELFGFCMVIIAVITLARQDNNKKR